MVDKLIDFFENFDIKKDWLFVVFIIVLLTLIIYFFFIIIFTKKNEKYLANFTNGKNNIRLFKIDFKNNKVYMVDKRDLKTKRIETLEWFYSGYTDEDALKVKIWLSELIKKDRSVQKNIEVHIKLKNHKRPIFSVLTCTSFDYKKQIAHFESHLFPNIKQKRFYKDFTEKIKTIEEISKIYNTNKRRHSHLYFIRIFPKDSLSGDSKEILNNKVLMTLLMSRINLHLKNSMSICLSISNELIILDTRPNKKNKTIVFCRNLVKEISKILFLHSLHSSYAFKIGVQSSKEEKKSFEEFVNSAKELTMYSLGKNDINNFILYDTLKNNHFETKKEIIDKINNIVKNKTFNVEYSPLVNSNNGHLAGFFTNIEYKDPAFSSLSLLLEQAYTHNLIDEVIDLLYKQINSVYINKYFITSDKRRLFLDVKIEYYRSILNALENTKLPENVKTIFTFNDEDIIKQAANNKTHLIEILMTLKENNQLRLGLEFSSTSIDLGEDILNYFDYFVFNYGKNFSTLLTSSQEQILFQNMRNTLMEYHKGKLTAVNLTSWQAIEYFADQGFKYVSGNYFGNEINKLPTLDTKKINKLLSLND